MRTGPQVPHTNCTFDRAMRLSCSAIPPFTLRCGFGRTCFFTIMTCSTRILLSFGNTRRTRPSLPLSRPVMTLTLSFRRISTRLCSVLTVLISNPSIFFRRDVASYVSTARFYRTSGASETIFKNFFSLFAGHWAENAGSDRLASFVDQHCSILVEADIGAVAASVFFVSAHNHRFDDRSFLYLPVGRRFFHAGGDHVAQASPQSG